MSNHKVICKSCDLEMTELYQIHGPAGQAPTRMLHCTGCSGVTAVQDVKATAGGLKAGVQIEEDGQEIVPPVPAPDRIEIVRESLDPDKLRSRLLGKG
jgi:hypothetical protein